jgi:putative nucleotidyltransferase with HDIG domain
MDGVILAAGGIAERRAGMREAILAGVPDSKNSVFAQAFAECFVDRVADAIHEDAWTPLLTWVDATYRRHGESKAARALFLAAPRVIAKTLDEIGADPSVRERFRTIAREISTIVAVIPGSDHSPLTGTIEETDVLLSGVVGELRSLDPTTAEHSQAVSAWCGRIAARLGLSRADTMKVTRGGLIHDFGKTSTPKHILTAPRSLSDEEWDVMRRHVLAGEHMVCNTPLLRQFCSIVRSHHERYDGLGYPDGLDSHRIPITVRIVSVADSFNAMIAPRPYRPAMSPAHALEELKRCKGSQFDPNVVDAMIDIVTNQPEKRNPAS